MKSEHKKNIEMDRKRTLYPIGDSSRIIKGSLPKDNPGILLSSKGSSGAHTYAKPKKAKGKIPKF